MMNSSYNMKANPTESNDETILFTPKGNRLKHMNPHLMLFLASASLNLEIFLCRIFYDVSPHNLIFQLLTQSTIQLVTIAQALGREYCLRKGWRPASRLLNFLEKFGKFLNSFCLTSLYVSQVKVFEKSINERHLEAGGIHLVTALTILYLICTLLNKCGSNSICWTLIYIVFEICLWFILVIFYNERNINNPLPADSQSLYFYMTALISLSMGFIFVLYSYRMKSTMGVSETFYKEVLSNMEMGIVCLNKKNELIFRNCLAYNYVCQSQSSCQNIVPRLEPDSVISNNIENKSFMQCMLARNITVVKRSDSNESSYQPSQLKLEEILSSYEAGTTDVRYFFSENRKMNFEVSHKNTNIIEEDKSLWQDDAVGSHNRDTRFYELKIIQVATGSLFDSFKILSISEISQSSVFLQFQEHRRVKHNLLSALSHELNTPLNGSLTLIDCALSDNELPSTFKQKYMIQSRVSMQSLKYLINDIIDFLKIETKQLMLDVEDFEPLAVINEIVDMIKPKCEPRQLEFVLMGSMFEVSPRAQKPFRSDPLKLRRLLFNLLNNCAKYTFSGSISLRADLTMNNSRMDFEISDTRFAKGTNLSSNSYSDKQELGVLVCKDLAKIMNPKDKPHGLNIEVMENIGIKYSFSIRKISPGSDAFMFPSIFQFLNSQRNMDNCSFGSENLPFVDDGMDGQSNSIYRLAPIKDFFYMNNFSEKANRVIKEDETPQIIMIVDDDSFNIMSLETILKKLGFSCIKAFNGHQAIEKVREFYKEQRESNSPNISAIFMDLMMPVMGGLRSAQVLKKIMKKGEVPQCHIFGCSANDSREDVANCKYAGMSGFISKPLTIDKVDTLLRKFNI